MTEQLFSTSMYFYLIVLFIADCLFFHSSMSLLNSSCIFSIHASSLFVCACILFSTFWSSLLSLIWILFQLNCLFSLHLFGLVDFYHVSSSAVCFSVFSFCLTYCVLSLFSTGLNIVVPLNCGICSPWVGFNQCIEGVLVGEIVPFFCWMKVDLVYLKSSTMSSNMS